MTRIEVYREVLRFDAELKAARNRLKDAQMRGRLTGMKIPAQEFAAMWQQIYRLETAVETARLQLALAEETSAAKFVAIARAEHPAVFALLAKRAGVEV